MITLIQHQFRFHNTGNNNLTKMTLVLLYGNELCKSAQFPCHTKQGKKLYKTEREGKNDSNSTFGYQWVADIFPHPEIPNRYQPISGGCM